MGLVSLIGWLFPPAPPPPSHISPRSSLDSNAQSVTRSYPPCSYDSPGPKHVTFTLSMHLYGWLEAMAMLHNYGSVHKSIRDLLEWACTARDDDMEWLFSTPHEVPACLDMKVECELEASTIATKTKTRCMRRSPLDPITLDARISDSLHHWIENSVSHFGLEGPSDVLEAVCKCAIELHAADDIFESDESGHDLPTSTAELYHDLGLIRH